MYDCELYEKLGCHPLPEGGYRFGVWAPNARKVSLVGQFNHWDSDAAPMERDKNGIWYRNEPLAEHGHVYKYAVTGRSGETFLKADPVAFHSETGPATGSKVWDISGYAWGDEAWLRRRKKQDLHREAMSVYEVHPGSWKIPENAVYPWYRQLAHELAEYCTEMGFTHVELLPVTEYPFEGSWGYQTTGYFAPTSRYGTPQDFMYLVDMLHQAGIGVILDWVPAHFPRDAHGLANFDGTALYERQEPRMAAHPEWGTLIFDHGRREVRDFLIASALFWLALYHVDGLRVDAVTSMLYLDYCREPDGYTPNREGGNIDLNAVAFLRQLNETVLTRFPGVVTIAEESSAYPGVTHPPYDGGLGFSFKWDMGFMHDTLDYFAEDPIYRKSIHEKLTFSMMYAFSESYVLAFSHDEMVHGKKSMLDKMYGGYEQKFDSLRALYGYQFAHPGKKLLFMGAEFGQFIEWDYKRQLDWFLLKYPSHDSMKTWVQALNRFYRKHPQLYRIENSWDGFQWLSVDERERSAIAFVRRDEKGKALLCAFNFTPVETVISVPLEKGRRPRTLLSSAEARFGGSGLKARYSAGKLYLPPMCAVYMSC